MTPQRPELVHGHPLLLESHHLISLVSHPVPAAWGWLPGLYLQLWTLLETPDRDTHLPSCHRHLDAIFILNLTWPNRSSHFPLSNLLISQWTLPPSTHHTYQTFSSVLWSHAFSCYHIYPTPVWTSHRNTSQFHLPLSLSSAITLLLLMSPMRTAEIVFWILFTCTPVHLPT